METAIVELSPLDFGWFLSRPGKPTVPLHAWAKVRKQSHPDASPMYLYHPAIYADGVLLPIDDPAAQVVHVSQLAPQKTLISQPQ